MDRLQERPATGALVEAGLELLSMDPSIDRLSTTNIAAKCQVPPETLLRDFGSRNHYLEMLANHLMEDVMREAINKTRNMYPGLSRMMSFADALLDGVLARPALRALHSALGETSEGGVLRHTRRSRWTELFRSEMEAAGVTESALPARLAALIALELCANESSSGERHTEQREVLRTYLEQVLC